MRTSFARVFSKPRLAAAAALAALLLAPLTSFAAFTFGGCETFEGGAAGWSSSQVSGGGTFGTSGATYSSASTSLYTAGGAISVTSPAVDLGGVLVARVSVWVRRGGNFSDRPDHDEDLQIQYRDSSGSYQTLEQLKGGAAPGEIFTRSYPLPADAFYDGFRIRFRQLGGDSGDDYWHIDDVCIASALVSYQFEEASWSSAAGQVLDSGENGLHGTAYGNATTASASPSPAIDTDPGTCRYGAFDGATQYVQVPDHPALDLAEELTVTAWIYPKATPAELQTIVSKDTNYEFHLNSSRQIYWWWNGPTLTTTGAAMSLNEWHHVAITYRSGSQKIYIDGVERASGTLTGTLPQNDDPLFIATDLSFPTRDFNGYIDEVRIIPQYLSQAEIQSVMNEKHPCANAARFTINHDGFGINCVEEQVTVNVIDATAGTPLTSYNAQVRLDTQTGAGTWRLITGTGAFSDGAANDGVATYTWPLGQSQAVFGLSYAGAAGASQTMDVDVVQVSDTGVRDNDAEGTLAFAPSGFTVTAAALSNPPPAAITTFATPQTAGTTFDLHIAAYGQTPTDNVCGIIEAYTGAKSVKFWSTYVSPASGSRRVTIDSSNAATSEASATAQSVAFTNGQAVVQAKYKDVGRVRIALKDDTPNAALPSGIRGATQNFVSRPNDLQLSGITSSAAVANPQATTPSGAVFTSAGTPFNMTLTARDAEGDAVPNFGKETSPETETVRLDVTLVAPVGGAAPALSPSTLTAFTGGVADVKSFRWSEVGAIRLTAEIGDGDYLGTGNVSTLSGNIGRFTPAYFQIALNSPRFTAACAAGPVNAFTYVGQPFRWATRPVITATAMSADNLVTQNYTFVPAAETSPPFFKLRNDTVTGLSYSSLNAPAAAPLAIAGQPATDPAIAVSGAGEATLTFSGATTDFSFAKGAPTSRFTAGIQARLNVIDADGVAPLVVASSPLSNPVTFGSGAGIEFDSTTFPFGEIRYGRVRLANAYGSERVDLPVAMRAEYYDGDAAGFTTNTIDSCTANVTLAFGGYTENLGAGETCVRDNGSPGASAVGCAAPAALGVRYTEPPALGDFNLRLAAPGATGGVPNTGSVRVDATVPAWLRFDWNSALPGDENPSALATFGLFGGESRQIYLREIY